MPKPSKTIWKRLPFKNQTESTAGLQIYFYSPVSASRLFNNEIPQPHKVVQKTPTLHMKKKILGNVNEVKLQEEEEANTLAIGFHN